MMPPRTTVYCVWCSVALLALLADQAVTSAQAPRSFLVELIPSWSVDLGVSPRTRPFFNRRYGVIALDSDQLVAVTLPHGKRAWSATLVTSAAPALSDSLAFAAAGRILIALNLEDGAERWRVDLGDIISGELHWDTGWLFASTQTGILTALSATEGKVVWYRPLGSALAATPVPAGNHLYVPLEDGRIMALALQTGAIVWERRLGGRPSGILPLEDRLFVGSHDNYFYCLRVKDGKQRWRWRTGGDVVGDPVVDEKRVYFLSRDNLLRALDRHNGHQCWKQPLADRPIGGLTLIAGHLLVASGTPAGRYTYTRRLEGVKPADLIPPIRAYAAVSGAPAGEFRPPGELASVPHVIARDAMVRLILLTNEGVVHAYETASTIEPPLVPLQALPGIESPVSRQPVTPRPSLP